VSTPARLEDNIGFACADLQCRLGRESVVAMRWLGSDGERKEFTFGQLACESSRFAAVLAKLGVAPGDRFFIMLPKLPEVFIAVLGGLKARAVVGPVFANFGDEALSDRLGDSRACVLLTKRSLLKKVQRIRDRLPELRHVLLVDEDDHLASDILSYRRLMRDFIQGAQMPEVKIAALRDLSQRIKSLDENGINYSIIDGLQRSWCYSTTVLLALHREQLVADRCITVDAWDYFRPFIEKLGDPETATRILLSRTIRYEIYYNIDLEGLLHYMVTFNTAQRRMSLQVQLEIMRRPLIDEIEAAAKITVFRDTHDIEATGKTQKPRDQFAASDIAVSAEAFITNNAQASQREVADACFSQRPYH